VTKKCHLIFFLNKRTYLIDLEVLSVVAQQISTIHEAKAAKVKTFIFEGAELNLNPNCSM
jgi:dynein heavy chain